MIPTRGLGRVALGLCNLAVLFSRSVVSDSLWDCSTPGVPVLHYLFAQVHVRWVRWCHPTIWSSVIPFSSCLQSFPASGSLLINWLFALAIASFSFSISPSNEYSGLISFRIDWLDLLAVQGTLKSLLQHYNSKASVLQRSAFFMVQLSHRYVTTGKARALQCCIVSGLLCWWSGSNNSPKSHITWGFSWWFLWHVKPHNQTWE